MLTFLIPVALVGQADTASPEMLDAMEVESAELDVNNVLPKQPIQDLFGTAKTPLEIPRAISSVSQETIARYGMETTRDFVSVVPGAFTPSNYGIDGGLRIRGEDGEVYFRGFRKLQNTALFPTPIGATQRVDVVRGPASVAFGPSRNSGYMNFVPRSARSESLKFVEDSFGAVSLTYGSYDKKKASLEYGQPFRSGDTEGGLFVFLEAEDSGSFYRFDGDESILGQFAVDMDIGDRWTVQAGFMYFDWEGKNNIGWNRVTPELIANGTYLTGQPININSFDGVMGETLSPSDFSLAAGNGAQGGQPFQFASGFSVFFPFGAIPPEDPNAPGESLWRLEDVGTATISPKQTLVDSIDFVWVENFTAYADVIYRMDAGTFKNQVFFDTYDSENYASYGFTGAFNNSVIENRATYAFEADLGESLQLTAVAGGTIRYFDGEGLNAFGQGMQHADRRDLIAGPTPNDRSPSALDGDRSWSLDEVSEYTNWGLFVDADLELLQRAILTVGVRYDRFDVETVSNGDFNASGPASADDGEFSYSLSGSLLLPGGLRPYVSYAESIYLLGDANGGTFDSVIVGSGDYLQDATLLEAGIKGSVFEDRLFFAAAVYRQDRARTDPFGAPIALESEGIELEFRFVPNARFSLTGAATWSKAMIKDDGLFVRVPLSEVERQLGTTIDPADYYGGVVESTVNFLGFPGEYEASGQPDKVFSLYGTYMTPFDLGLTLGGTYVPDVPAGWFDDVILPSYVLANATLFYHLDNWAFSLSMRNLLDEQYFTPQVFWDDLLVLPSEGLTADITVTYSW
ncbi:MAG: TonB-dependent siderophore receptor [Opitutales bacterium]